MQVLKIQGFSLVELLITLALASFTLSLFILHLNTFGLASARMLDTMRTQDYAIAALILLQHQIEAASITECTNDPRAIDNQSHNPDFLNVRAYQILSPTELKLHQLSATFYVSLAPESPILTTPNGFPGQTNDLVVIDDCRHALISSIISKTGKSLEIAAFKPADFALPFSVSLVDTRLYFFQDQTLYLQKNNGNRNKVIPALKGLVFTDHGIEINGQYHAAF